MSGFPAEVVALIVAREGAWSDHAAEERDRLALDWADVEQVARTAVTCKRTVDRTLRRGYVYAGTGRCLRGRSLYMAGKKMSTEGEVNWYVISIHEGKS